ncbi:hypothetical protein [Gymnodinialimonas ulvae]|uniref:hypothetical protein n=1 Tax=Gymnodinialimonas ulvae TaxID=3126504 RepID=UPI0030AD0085
METPTNYKAAVPGGDWWATYYNGKSFWFERVVIFCAMLDPEDRDREQFVGIDQVCLNNRINQICEEQGWFLGYAHSSEFAELGETLSEVAQQKMLALHERLKEEEKL